MVDRRRDKKLSKAKKWDHSWYTQIEDILDNNISPVEQLLATIESDKQTRRQALPLPCKELQFKYGAQAMTKNITDDSWTNLHQNVKGLVTNYQQQQHLEWAALARFWNWKDAK